LPGFKNAKGLSLFSVSVSRSRYSLSSQGFTLFATTIFTRLFIGFFHFQSFKKAVILDFLLQNAHRLFKVIIKNLDLNIFQYAPPLFCPPAVIDMPDGYLTII